MVFAAQDLLRDNLATPANLKFMGASASPRPPSRVRTPARRPRRPFPTTRRIRFSHPRTLFRVRPDDAQKNRVVFLRRAAKNLKNLTPPSPSLASLLSSLSGLLGVRHGERLRDARAQPRQGWRLRQELARRVQGVAPRVRTRGAGDERETRRHRRRRGGPPWAPPSCTAARCAPPPRRASRASSPSAAPTSRRRSSSPRWGGGWARSPRTRWRRARCPSRRTA